MSPRLIELALRKQRLQIRSAALREAWASDVGTIAPIFSAIDGARRAASWAKAHAHLLAAFGTAVLLTRPRALLRWARRGAVAYRLWRTAQEKLFGQPIR